MASSRATTLAQRIEAHFSDRSARRGLLVTFEGPDGSGKTTQRKLFKTWLKSEGYEVTTTKWNSSALIKPIIKSRKATRSLSGEEFSLLHAADFRHRVERDVLPALWAGKLVIADRFLFTALARDVARGLEPRWVKELYRPFLWPDIVFYFAVSPETSSERVSAMRTPSYYEAGQDVTLVSDANASYGQFITRVIREYKTLAAEYDFVTIDAEQPIVEQHHSIRRLFRERESQTWSDRNTEVFAQWLSGPKDIE